MTDNKVLLVDSHEILWSSRKFTIERACVHEGTPDAWWDVRNVYLVATKPEYYLIRGKDSMQEFTELSKNEARALAAVLLEFARDK